MRLNFAGILAIRPKLAGLSILVHEDDKLSTFLEIDAALGIHVVGQDGDLVLRPSAEDIRYAKSCLDGAMFWHQASLRSFYGSKPGGRWRLW